MKNISGNYDTENEEIAIVEYLLREKGIEYSSISKSPNADNEDIIVNFGRRNIKIEVKSESSFRIHKYNDLGIDYISAFQFKNREDENNWKGPPKNPVYLNKFESEIIIRKVGKINYSKADLWLFYSIENNDPLFNDWFTGEFMTSNDFVNYLRKNCKFAVNNKPNSQMSYNDNHQSAVFFINRDDCQLNNNRIENLKSFILNLIENT